MGSEKSDAKRRDGQHTTSIAMTAALKTKRHWPDDSGPSAQCGRDELRLQRQGEQVRRYHDQTDNVFVYDEAGRAW